MILEEIEKNDVIIDCGAYLGKFSNYVADKGAIVYSFEPCKELHEGLLKRFEAYKNVVVINKGLSSKPGIVKFFKHKEYDNEKKDNIKFLESSSIFPKKGNVGNEYFQAETIKLSEFISSLNTKVKLVKINVEGAEYGILNNLIDSKVIYNIKYIIVSFHNHKILELEGEHKVLKKEVMKSRKLRNIIIWNWWADNRHTLNLINKAY